MLLKLLGFIDLIVASLLLLTEFGMPITRFYIIFILLHAIKAMFFLKNLFSIVDLAIVGYTLTLPFWSNPIITIVVAVFLVYKGLYSQL